MFSGPFRVSRAIPQPPIPPLRLIEDIAPDENMVRTNSQRHLRKVSTKNICCLSTGASFKACAADNEAGYPTYSADGQGASSRGRRFRRNFTPKEDSPAKRDAPKCRQRARATVAGTDYRRSRIRIFSIDTALGSA